MLNIDISGIKYIEFYVGNLLQASHFYQTVLGFTPIGYRECKYAINDGVSILLKQRNIHLILTSSHEANSLISKHIYKHGDGVKDIALITKDTKQAFFESVKLGAKAVFPPTIIEDDNCGIIKATIATFGKTQHSFIQNLDNSKDFLPGFKPYSNVKKSSATGLQEIDHLAVCVAEGTLNTWGDFYKNILGFHESYRENIYTGKSGMNSFVVENASGNVKITLLESASGVNKSQIKDFLDFNRADGVQHIAFLSHDIVQSVHELKKAGLEFLYIPKSYYETLSSRVKNLRIDINVLEKLQVLADHDKDGGLFQIFSKVISNRPTFFIEIIQRQGAQSFGSGNIRALFEAIEREQTKA